MADDRLTGLDASFLHLEDESAHMHVAAVLLFEGEPPDQREVAEALEQRLHLVPRYRQKLAFVPLGQGRPVWVDDPHFNLDYHVRKTALPGARQRGAAAQPGRPRVLAAARPRQAAVGAVDRRGARGRPLRGAVEDPPRAGRRRVRRRHRVRPVRHPARARRRRPTPASAGCLARALAARSCWATRSRSGCRSPRRSPAASAPRCARRGGSRCRRTSRWSASGRWPGPG